MNLFPDRARFSSGRVIYKAGGRFGPRVQPCYQLCPIHRGSMRVRIEGREHRVEAGESILLVPGKEETFRFATDRETEHSWLHVQTEDLRVPRLDALAYLTLRSSSLLNDLVLHCADLSLRPQGENRELHDHLCIGAFLEFIQIASSGPTPGRPLPEPVMKALSHLQRNLGAIRGSTELAAAAGVTQQHLTRLFRRHLGETPAKYLWRKRRERGLELLRHTGLSVSEIANRCGYQSPFHFSRVVREHTGRPPSRLGDIGALPQRRTG